MVTVESGMGGSELGESESACSVSGRSALDLVRRAAELLRDNGIESPRADAELLMAYVLGIHPGRLLLVDCLEPSQLKAFRTAVDQRASRIPLQHIIGRAAFGPLELAVGPGVFVPRPETEMLLEWAVQQAKSFSHPATMVDLCSGSGALALGMAAMVPSARVIAVEKDPEALMWLRRNVAESGLAAQVAVVIGDVTDPVRMAAQIPTGSVDLIVSNPPYVPAAADVALEVAHDPAQAVFGGADGMSVIGPMIATVADALRPGGAVGIEHDDTTSAQVADALHEARVFDDISARTDLAGRPRFVTALRREGAINGPAGGHMRG